MNAEERRNLAKGNSVAENIYLKYFNGYLLANGKISERKYYMMNGLIIKNSGRKRSSAFKLLIRKMVFIILEPFPFF